MKHLVFPTPTRGEGRFIRQQGSPGRYGHVVLLVQSSDQPLLPIEWSVPEECIPLAYMQAISQGITGLFEAESKFSKWSPTGFSVRVIGGSHHETDSNEVSYTLAAAEAFIHAVENSGAANQINTKISP